MLVRPLVRSENAIIPKQLLRNIPKQHTKVTAVLYTAAAESSGNVRHGLVMSTGNCVRGGTLENGTRRATARKRL